MLDALRNWLNATLLSVLVKSPLTGAIHYPLVSWPALTRFCDDGRIEIDTNTAEPAANTYSLVGTCLLTRIYSSA